MSYIDSLSTETAAAPMAPSTDIWKEAGHLVLVRNVDDVRTKVRVEKKPKGIHAPTGTRPALQQIVGHIEDILNGRAY